MRKSMFISILLISVVTVNSVKIPEAELLTPDLIKYWGYPVETHEALTSDGYFLTIHRIPHGKISTTASPTTGNKERPVFFLQHGLLCSSASWVINLPHQSLGFMLADAGFDVWMGNDRGNTYSKRHASLNTSTSAFWDFCFDDMAKYDLPTMIDYVLNKTHQKQLYYVGYSQGAMIVFAGLNENKELRKKIKINFLLGPASRIRHVNNLLKTLASHESQIMWWFKLLDMKEFLPSYKVIKHLSAQFCGWAPKLCEIIVFLIAGYDKKYLNETRLPVYVAHMPAGTSVKNIVHYSQMVNTKLFQKYDYGPLGNQKHYSSKLPPQYDLGKINTPTVLIYGSKDTIVTPEDVKWTSQHLPNVIKLIEIEGYNHLDFTWAPSAGKEINEKIINMVRKPSF